MAGLVSISARRGLRGRVTRWAGEGAARPRPLFADLLRELGAVPGIRRIRFTSPHPKDLRPETIAAMAETPAVCEQLHLPLQSGSDKILAAMRRGYTAERYLGLLEKARAAVGDLAVTTDIIVGFPGETEEDFERTLEVASQAAYDSAYTFIFSPRPGTPAAEMTELYVPADEIADRFDRLKVVIERSALARNQARVGRIEEVIVEGPPKRTQPCSRDVPARESSSTSPPGEGDGSAPGSFATVRIEHAAPHHLAGTLVSLEEPPPAGRRVAEPIPVSCRLKRAPAAGRRAGLVPIGRRRVVSLQWAVVSVFAKVLRAGESKKVRSLAAIVPSINALEPEIQASVGRGARSQDHRVQRAPRTRRGPERPARRGLSRSCARRACAPSASATSTSSSWAAWRCTSGGSPR